MLALRYLSLLALATWVGGLIVLGGIAAPAAFDTLGGAPSTMLGASPSTPLGASGRVLAGAVFGETLRRFHLLSYLCGAVVMLSLLARRILGPRPRPFAVRLGIAMLMLAASAYSGVVVSAQILRAQAEIGIAPSSLPAADPRQARFARLHAMSTSLELIPLTGGLILLFWELKD